MPLFAFLQPSMTSQGHPYTRLGRCVLKRHGRKLGSCRADQQSARSRLFSRDRPIPFAQTFGDHCYLAPSGMWSYSMLQHALAEVGADRILFSIDYPFILPLDGAARKFLEEAPISYGDKHRIGHLNAEGLVNLET